MGDSCWYNKPFNKLVQKEAKFQWSAQYQSAFENSKKALCMKPILQYPNTHKLYILFIDASHYAYSGVLTQVVHGPDDLEPTAYTSGLFSDM